MFTALPLYVKAELRAITKRLEILERSLVRTSVRPSLKYSCSGSLLRGTKGRMVREGLSGSGNHRAVLLLVTGAAALAPASITRYPRPVVPMLLALRPPRYS